MTSFEGESPSAESVDVIIDDTNVDTDAEATVDPLSEDADAAQADVAPEAAAESDVAPEAAPED